MPKVNCLRCGKKFRYSARKAQQLRKQQRREHLGKHGSLELEGYMKEMMKDAMLGKTQAYWEYSKYCPDCRVIRQSEIEELNVK